MLLDITQEDRQLWVSYFNLDGKTRFKTYDLQPEDMFNWEVCEGGDPKAVCTIHACLTRMISLIGAAIVQVFTKFAVLFGLPRRFFTCRGLHIWNLAAYTFETFSGKFEIFSCLTFPGV